MNRILLETQETRYVLPSRDPRFEHVRGVLRMGPGEVFDVGVPNGPVGRAAIERIEDGELHFTVEWGDRPVLPPDVHLLIGLCRPATVRKILSTAPTLGVRSIHFAATAHSDPAYARSSLWAQGEWRNRLLEGVEQAFDTFVPHVHCHDRLDAACSALPASAQLLALDVYEGMGRLSEATIRKANPLVLAIGPERGWAPADRIRLREAGFELWHLGSRVMRVETALIAGLAVILTRLGCY